MKATFNAALSSASRIGLNRMPSAPAVAMSVVSALVLTAVMFVILGLNPLDAFWAMLRGALGSNYAIGQTLTVTTPLILTGLAAVIPFSARLWNVGAEGQFYAGAIVSVLVGLTFVELPPLVLVIVCMASGVLGGAAWGLIPGLLKAVASVNEVIVTIMLNFVAVVMADFVIRAWGENIQQTTRPLPAGVDLPVIWPGTPLKLGFVLAICVAIASFVLLQRTPLGLGIRAAGFGGRAARLAGFKPSLIAIAAFVIGGACAGLAGAILVVAVNHALVTHMSASYGLTGVAVALVARLNALAVIPAAFFFAVITVGGANLTAGFGILTSASYVIVALFVTLLLAFRLVTFKYPET